MPAIKDTKIKSIKYNISQYKDYKIERETQRKAFGELFNDPDYYQYLLQEMSGSLIIQLEEFKKNSSPEKDKNLILSLPKLSLFYTYQNTYWKIEKLLEIHQLIRNFYEQLEESTNRLEQLNQIHRLQKSLDKDPYFFIALNKVIMGFVIECNLDLLQYERTSK